MSHRALVAVVLTASTLTAACGSGPRLTPNLALPAAFEAPPAIGAPAPLDAWWTAFDDSVLTGLIDTALKASPDARTAAARVDEALATRRGALAAYNPQGNIVTNAQRGYSQVEGASIPGFSASGANESYSVNFNVSWELDLFGRRGAARRSADADLAAARFNAEASRWSLVANVASSYFQARALAVQLDNAQETLRVQRQLDSLATRKADAGLGARADSDRVAGDLSQAAAQVEALTAQLQAARRSLLILIGRGTEPTAVLPIPAGVAAIPAPPQTTPGELLARRPDVREASARLVSAKGRLKLDELALFPKFTLSPGLGISRSVQPNFESVTKSWTLGLGATVPVLNRGQLKSEIGAQGARVDQQVIAYERAVQTAYGEAENALTQLAADRRRIDLLVDGEARARRAYEAGRRRYADGIDDLTQALTAEQSWRATRAALTGAQADAAQRAVQTFKALGGGWTPTPGANTPTTTPSRTQG